MTASKRLWVARDSKNTVIVASCATKPQTCVNEYWNEVEWKTGRDLNVYICYNTFRRLVGPLKVGEVRELKVRLGR